MNENISSGNNPQAQPEPDILNIVDWLRKAIDLDQHLFEPELLASHLAEILGVDSLRGRPTPTTPADQLACFLIELRDAVSAGERQRQQALEMMRRAVEICFIHSPVFRLALKLYTLELTGEVDASAWRAAALTDVESFYGMMETVIERSQSQDARDAEDRESREPASDRIRERQAKVQRSLDSQWLDEKTLDWIEALVESPLGRKDEGFQKE